MVKEIANYDYVYIWGNNPVRAGYKGKRCRVLARGGSNSWLIEFEDGEQTCSSRRALRRIK